MQWSVLLGIPIILIGAACARVAEVSDVPGDTSEAPALQPTPTATPDAERPRATRATPVPSPEPQPSAGALAYVTIEGSLWVRLADGGRKLIYAPENGQVYYPEWSPDGGRIAFTEVNFVKEGTDFSLADIMTVVVVDIEGREILRVPRAMMPHWSPDGRSLAVGAEPDVEGLTTFLTPSIVDVETGAMRELVPRVSALDSPRWRPGGNLLVYATRDGLYVIGSTEGSTPRRIVAGQDFTKFYLTPSWFTDAKIISFESDRSADTPPGGVDSYVIVDMDRGVISRVGDSYPSKCGRSLFFRDQEAHWVPGTTSAAWGIQCTGETTKPGIWIKDMLGGEERFLDTSSVVRSVGLLDVSPDGKLIAFSDSGGSLGYTREAQLVPEAVIGIYVVSVEGGHPELLVEDARFPIWQPGSPPARK